jgi:general secretion pathway protein G
MKMKSIIDHVGSRGVSLIELVVTLTILAILGSLVLPSARMTAKRTKEIELRRNLRTIRLAIDDFKKAYERAVDEKKITPGLQDLNGMSPAGYPKTLRTLVEGADFGGVDKNQAKKKFLRRIPTDPFYPEADEEKKWGLRSFADKPDSKTWGGEDVFDVYSQSEETAIDGSKYNEW